MSVRRSIVVADEALVEHLTDVSFGSRAVKLAMSIFLSEMPRIADVRR